MWKKWKIWDYVSNFIKFDPFWSILDRSDPIWSKKVDHVYSHDKCDNFLKCHFLIGEKFTFDQVWSSLIHFGQIWSKKIKHKMDIFIIFKNVTTFYSNIFWYVQPLRSFFAERHSEKTHTQTETQTAPLK